MEELQDFKLDDLYDKMAMEEDVFQEWLAEKGLLHASRTCTCGNKMRKMRTARSVLSWQCNRNVHRPSQPSIGYKVGTFFENGPHLKQDHILIL